MFGLWCVDTRRSGMVGFTRTGHHCPWDTELSDEPLKVEIWARDRDDVDRH